MVEALHTELVMQLTAPQSPQSTDFDALRTGLNQFNESVTGPLPRERIASFVKDEEGRVRGCLLYTSPSPRDGLLSRMPSSA